MNETWFCFQAIGGGDFGNVPFLVSAVAAVGLVGRPVFGAPQEAPNGGFVLANTQAHAIRELKPRTTPAFLFFDSFFNKLFAVTHFLPTLCFSHLSIFRYCFCVCVCVNNLANEGLFVFLQNTILSTLVNGLEGLVSGQTLALGRFLYKSTLFLCLLSTL